MLTFKTRLERGNVSDTVSDAIVLREAFVENTYSLHDTHFVWTGVMVDIGANIGAVTVLACALGATRVVAYEPEPENYQLLVGNIARNGYGKTVETHQKAIWSMAGTIALVPSQGASTSRPAVIDAYPNQTIQVPSITLAQALTSFDSVDVVKVDTEGAEYEMFGDRDTNRKIRLLVLEYHQATTAQFGGLVAQLSLTHNVQVFGHYDTDGGQLVAKRYGD